jgi:glycosyltransferase involved in cell wall biosynthesis
MIDMPAARHATVTLGVPAYNEGPWIERTLRSIQCQSHQNFAVLLSDNASTDGTSDACADMARQDPRFVHVRHQSNKGAAFNFHFARIASESPYFGWVGAHDLLHPEFLSVHLGALRAQPSAAGSFTYFEWIDGSDRSIQRDGDTGIATPRHGAWTRYLWSIAIGSDLGPMHALFRRDAIPDVPVHPVVAADHVLLASIAFRGCFLAQPGHLYRLRHFHEVLRSETSMQRITGDAGVKPDLSATIAAYLADFDAMHPQGTPGHRMRPLVAWMLRDRLGHRSLRITKRLRSLSKRLHELRAWVWPRPTDQR